MNLEVKETLKDEGVENFIKMQRRKEETIQK